MIVTTVSLRVDIEITSDQPVTFMDLCREVHRKVGNITRVPNITKTSTSIIEAKHVPPVITTTVKS